jgi:hypothetical protein
MKNTSTETEAAAADESARAGSRLPAWLISEKTAVVVLSALVLLVWLPRFKGPIDLRWDGGVYYILGTSLAEGKGYKLLNEPGEIDAVQYPPLLPAIIAGYQLILGTSDPTIVGWWLRLSAFFVFIGYIFTVFHFLKGRLPLPWAFLGTVLCLLSVHVYFLSDLCFPEILFSFATVLFVLFLQRESSGTNSFFAYLTAVASYGLRTVGLAAFAAFVFESLINKRFKQAIWRGVLVLIPIFCWQFYIASVESSAGYNQPAYAYQRAPYMFYNVTYARNFSLENPVTPENGEARMISRFVANAAKVPANLGEPVSTLRGYWLMALQIFFGAGESTAPILTWLIFIALYAIGILIIGGMVLQFLRREWIVPLYLVPYLGAMCFTPFPDQYSRYLMPVVPFLALSLILFLLFLRNYFERVLSRKVSLLGSSLISATVLLIFLMQLFCLQYVFRNEFETMSYVDLHGRPVNQRLFFNNDAQMDFDVCVTFVKENAAPSDVVAAGTPHWVYLRTGLKAVMPPMENDPVKQQQMLDSVPVRYLIIGKDVIRSERYTLPAVERFPDLWRRVYAPPESDFAVYRRVSP